MARALGPSAGLGTWRFPPLVALWKWLKGPSRDRNSPWHGKYGWWNRNPAPSWYGESHFFIRFHPFSCGAGFLSSTGGGWTLHPKGYCLKSEPMKVVCFFWLFDVLASAFNFLFLPVKTKIDMFKLGQCFVLEASMVWGSSRLWSHNPHDSLTVWGSFSGGFSLCSNKNPMATAWVVHPIWQWKKESSLFCGYLMGYIQYDYIYHKDVYREYKDHELLVRINQLK